MANKNPKVIRYRRPINLNIGMIVFFIFFLYLAYNVAIYLTKDRVQIYEVGEISSAIHDSTYDGLILRQEEVYTAPKAGYINFYIREGNRAAVGDVIYSIDENGAYTNLVNSGTSGDSTLSNEQLDALKKKLTVYTSSYQSGSFHRIYDLKFQLENQLLSYLGTSTLEELENLGIDTKYLSTVESVNSGIVEYYTDGMESLTEDKLTSDYFPSQNYKANAISSGSLLEKDAPVYKTITSETWNVYLPLSEKDQADMADEKTAVLHFNDVNLEVTADFSLIKTSDGQVLGKCTLSKYMIQLADRRYTSVTLKKSKQASLNVSGLKIPTSSLVTKEFYTIPLEFGTIGGNDSKTGFIREVYTAEGTKAEFISPAIYAEDDNYYYAAKDDVDAGVILLKPESDNKDGNDSESSGQTKTTSQTFTIGSTADLKGVYSVNKGYTVFKQIDILLATEDYYVVASGQEYGLSVYDHILLNGSHFEEGELIY
ncbi:MAG: HlyD family efflux transporter periplasmic adaptor subunit [Clostridiales bacterium]|nr:HlyD family efflux transporter periplasmic adaptor subunit [Clostridiales bacterium]